MTRLQQFPESSKPIIRDARATTFKKLLDSGKRRCPTEGPFVSQG